MRENSHNAIRIFFEVENGMIEARYISGIWSASTSSWVNTSNALLEDHGVALDDHEGLARAMMERRQALRLVGITRVMDRTEVCLDKSSPHYNAPGVNGIANHEVRFSAEEGAVRPTPA